jgi:hypothetical protein
MDPKDPAEEPVLYLVPTAMRKFLLNHFPVLAMVVQEIDKEEILLESPLFGGEVGPQVVFVVVLELLVVAG